MELGVTAEWYKLGGADGCGPRKPLLVEPPVGASWRNERRTEVTTAKAEATATGAMATALLDR